MVWAWPISIDFSDNTCNFGCGTKKCMWAGDRKQLYYKSLSYTIRNIMYV